MLTSAKPASSRPRRYSLTDNAPAIQPAQPPRSARCSRVRASSATTSENPSRPPGVRTRKIEVNTAGLSTDKLITQLEITTSTLPSGSGMSSMFPCRNSTLVTPASAALRRASSTISGTMSSPYALPVGPTRRADSSTSMPPPEPRSSTVSPGRTSATASGLPQPRLASTAANGSWRRSSAVYSAAPKRSSVPVPSGAQHSEVSQQAASPVRLSTSAAVPA